MGERKQIMKLAKKVLKDDSKHHLYTDEELQYMKLALTASKLARAKKKLQHKKNKGFG